MPKKPPSSLLSLPLPWGMDLNSSIFVSPGYEFRVDAREHQRLGLSGEHIKSDVGSWYLLINTAERFNHLEFGS